MIATICGVSRHAKAGFAAVLLAGGLFGASVAAEPDAAPADRVEVAVLAEPSGPIDNWAGMFVAEDGHVYLTAGDHKGEGGNSWAYRFDPRSRTFERVLDVQWDGRGHYDPLSVGQGKFHAPPVRDGEGTLYLTTAYGGESAGLALPYPGSLMFALEPRAGARPKCLGPVFPGEGVFAAVFLQSVHAYAAVTLPSGRCQVHDVRTRKLLFRSDDPAGPEARLLARDGRDRVYFHGREGRVLRWNPADGSVAAVGIDVPSARALPPRAGGAWSPKDDLIRVMKPAGPAQDILIGVTNYGLFFRHDPATGATAALGHSLDVEPPAGPYYVADFALRRDGAMLYYVGGIENEVNGRHHDNPVIELDLATGGKRVLCRLNAVLLARKAGRFLYNYGASLAPDERTLYLCPDVSGGKVALVSVPLAEPQGGRE